MSDADAVGQDGRGENGAVSGTPESAHDCSTLGGNSGSCVVDLLSREVVGVHARDRYLVSNYAICTERIVDRIYSSTRG